MLKQKIIYIANLILVGLTAISFGACYVNPTKFAYLGFVTWSMPVLLVCNLAFVIYWSVLKLKAFWYSLITIVLCFSHIKASFQISVPSDFPMGIKILSYNTRVFNVYNHLGQKDHWKSTQRMTKWILAEDFDVMCLQEFYDEPTSKIFNTISQLKSKKKYFHYFYKTYTNRIKGQFGIATFSKYKIVNSGLVSFDSKSNNQIIFIDIIYKGDTIRVYNGHLVSNSIEDGEIPDAEFSQRSKQKATSLGKTLKRGFAKRGRQIDSLSQHIERCKHKVILCADLNDLPYSYSYRKLSSNLDNAFEQKGNGFGYTFNGKIPFLRIDQIFVGRGIKVHRFTTHSQIKYSDHYPISALVEVESRDER